MWYYILHGKYVGEGTYPEKFYLYAELKDARDDLERAIDKYGQGKTYLWGIESVKLRLQSRGRV